MALKTGGERRESHRSKTMFWCGKLWKNSSEHQKDIFETIKIKRFFILYYQILIGQKTSNSGQLLRTFEDADAQLAEQIEELQQDREALNQDYENAESMIKILKTNVSELEQKAKDVRIDSLKKINKVKHVMSLKEKLKIIEKEFSRDDISAEQIKEMMESLKQEQENE